MVVSQFLKLVELKTALMTRERLNPSTWSLLETIGMAEHMGEPLRVTTVMAMAEHGAPATVHRRLAHLRSKGFVGVTESPSDSRVKFLSLTAAAVKVFDELGQSLPMTMGA